MSQGGENVDGVCGRAVVCTPVEMTNMYTGKKKKKKKKNHERKTEQTNMEYYMSRVWYKSQKAKNCKMEQRPANGQRPEIPPTFFSDPSRHLVEAPCAPLTANPGGEKKKSLTQEHLRTADDRPPLHCCLGRSFADASRERLQKSAAPRDRCTRTPMRLL